MDKRLDGKMCIVTGAAMGIGAATAIRLAHEGGIVILADLDEAAAGQVAAKIRADGGRAEAVACNVGEEEDVKNLIAHVDKQYGRLDVLVNNAGISGPTGRIDDISLDGWNKLMAVNLTGVFLCTREALPIMRRQQGGSIINLSSIYGLVGSQDAAPYHASKGAVRLFTKATALQVAKDHIRVNSVHPGFIQTPMVEGFARASGNADTVMAALVTLHPLGRLGKAEEIAAGIAFLASEDASFMTGSELVIDGGYTAQ
ncbi:MAG: SDR family NAD(P)-dependent oxidoreductase [Bacillota bacterium]